MGWYRDTREHRCGFRTAQSSAWKLLAVLRNQADTQSATQSFDMIRLGNQLGLTGREVERFTRITGIEPVGVKSLDDLDDYIDLCKDCFGP